MLDWMKSAEAIVRRSRAGAVGLPRILVGMPSASGHPHYLTARALYRAQFTADAKVDVSVSVMSALAHNFNRLWAKALNERYDYFAMLHDDVVPPDNWLQHLLETVRAEKLDMVSHVIRLKSDSGSTSTASGWKHADRLASFESPVRLTCDDVRKLPAVFGYEHLPKHLRPYGDQGCLLLNTGCWIADLAKRYRWIRCWFEQNDTILVREDGTLAPRFEPEDWNFSRLANAQGLKLAALGGLECKHYGLKAW